MHFPCEGASGVLKTYQTRNMKRLMFLMLLVSCLSFVYTGCTEPDPMPGPDTEVGGGDEGSGDNGDAGDSGENVDPDIPEGFEEEPDDLASDPVMTFDYSVLAKARHPRLMIDSEGFKSLKEKVTTGRFTYKTLAKLHNEVIARAGKTADTNRKFTTTDDNYMIVDNLVTCAYAYRMTGHTKYLSKVRSDLTTLCTFPNWDYSNLSHGEISLAAAIAYDWLYYDLTLDERKMVRRAISEKSLLPWRTYDGTKHKGNWNSIKTSGVACAALAVYEKDKALSRTIIEKIVVEENLPATKNIYVGGGYTEGLHYWDYGGSYEVCLIGSLEHIFGHSAGLMEVPGLLESGKLATYGHGTAGTEYAYSDGGGNVDRPFVASWWFAAMNDDPDMMYVEKKYIDTWYKDTPMTGNDGDLRYRMLALMIAMIRDYNLEGTLTPPSDKVFECGGDAPLVIVRNGWKFDGTDTYLGIKGGLTNTGHAHMDVGSFIFEAEGERWSDDMMRPAYGDWFDALYAAGGNSGNSDQKAMRWDTYHISNLCHSTIVSYTNDGSVPDKLHSTDYYVDGFATIDQVIESGDRQGAVVNMAAPMKGQLKSAKRTIELVNKTELVVTDEITALDNLDCVLEWRMLSIAGSTLSSDKSNIVLTTKTKKTRTLTVQTSDSSISPELVTWKPECPHGTDGWCKPGYHKAITDRTIAGWKVTIPKGKTVKFTTKLVK